MQAIEFKVGNGKGIDRINEVIATTFKYQALVTEFFEVGGVSDIDFGTESMGISIKFEKFLNDIKDGIIDDGDIFDYINESGDVEFMSNIQKMINACDGYTVKYLLNRY